MSKNWQPEMMPTVLLSYVERVISKLVDQRFRDIGITSAQIPVLVALKNGEKLTQKELALIASVEQPSMAQLLARMERDGLITREVSPDDRRKSFISLTKGAEKKLELGRSILTQIDEDVCEVLNADEETELLNLFQRMVTRLRDLNASYGL